MKNTKILMISSAVAAMVLLGGALPQTYAGAASDTSNGQAETSAKPTRGNAGMFGFGGLQEQLLQYLSMDEATFKEKISTQTLAEIAEAQGIARADLKAKLVEWLESKLVSVEEKQAAEGGTVRAKTLDASELAEKWLDAQGRIGERGKGMGMHRGGGMMMASEELAEALGLTADELKDAMKSGQTLADVAAAQNVDVATLINLLAEKSKERLAAQLDSGKLTQDEYEARVGEITERVTSLVNGEMMPGGEQGMGMKRGGFSQRGERPATEQTEAGEQES
ncbi:hypothetical protein [Paenibacillus macerans]|uniref:hypothetical protein n=1 Tax=Paenibacillus macerans TaxID=44252 RepID=UPI003D32270F